MLFKSLIKCKVKLAWLMLDDHLVDVVQELGRLNFDISSSVFLHLFFVFFFTVDLFDLLSNCNSRRCVHLHIVQLQAWIRLHARLCIRATRLIDCLGVG